MATETVRLPFVDCVRVSKRAKGDDLEQNITDEKAENVAAFLASVRLGSLERHPRPGDVFKKSRYAPHSSQRPLGLLPDRETSSYSYFLPPIFPSAGLTSVPDPRKECLVSETGGTFRHPAAAISSRHLPSAVSHSKDEEYSDMLAKTEVEDYVSMVNVERVNVPFVNRHRRTKTVPESGTKLLQYAEARYVF